MLQSEGFYATFFFSLIVRGDDVRSEDVIESRYQKIMTALCEMFATKTFNEDSPHLLHFVETYARHYPEEAGEVTDVLLDLSHGVFVDPHAAELWRAHYAAALRIDLQNLGSEQIKAARLRGRELAKDPKTLYSQVGPEIACTVGAVKVQIVAFGDAQPLVFDLNTAPEGVMRLVPAISDAEVERWLTERGGRPFQSAQDFDKRVALNQTRASALHF